MFVFVFERKFFDVLGVKNDDEMLWLELEIMLYCCGDVVDEGNVNGGGDFGG